MVLLLLLLLLPTFIRTCLPSFAHSHSSTPTHPIPLTTPVLCSRSPAPTSPLPRSHLSALVCVCPFVFARPGCVYSSSCCCRCPAAIAVHPPSSCSPLPSAFVRPPLPACIYTIYPYSYPHLYPSPPLARSCLFRPTHSCLFPFVPICVASIRTHLCSLALLIHACSHLRLAFVHARSCPLSCLPV